MKKVLLTFLFAAIGLMTWAQTTVNLDETRLEDYCTANGIDPSTVTSLELTGLMKSADAYYLHENFKNLVTLDMATLNLNTADGTTYQVAAVNQDGGAINLNMKIEFRIIPAALCYGFEKLETVFLPNATVQVGNSSFSGCKALKNVYFCGKDADGNGQNGTASGNANFYQVQNYAFMNCTSLEEINLMHAKNNFAQVGQYAFKGCTALKSFLIHPDDYANAYFTVNVGAFMGCTALESIQLPGIAKSIGVNAFQGCTSLKQVTFSDNRAPYNYNTKEFLAVANLEIGNQAFVETGLTSFMVPNTCSKIGERSFYGLTSLTELSFEETSTLTTIGANAFDQTGLTGVIVLPASVTSVGDRAFGDLSYTIDNNGEPVEPEPVDYVVATIADKAQLNRNYDAGSDWYGYQVYNRLLAIDASGHDKANLALEFDVYVENLDHPGNVDNLFSYDGQNTVELLELGNDVNNGRGLTWGIHSFVKQEGWNHAVVKLTEAGNYARSTFTLTDKITWFRFCLAHVKCPDAYIIRLRDVKLVDLTGEKGDDNGEDTEFETSYEVADIPFTMDQSVEFAEGKDVGIVVGKAFDPVNVAKHDVKMCYLTFDADITLTGGAEFSKLGTNGQIELTSSGHNDVNEATFGIGSVEWKTGKNTYFIPLVTAGTTGGSIDWSNLNYMRLYWVHMPCYEGTMTMKIDNVKIVDFTTKTALPTLFSDGMMFQQQKPVNIWGYASEGKQISVELFRGDASLGTQTAVTGKDGKWLVTFDALTASYDKYHFTVSENGEVIQTVNDILVGEVWVAGGQSNMALSVAVTIDAEEIRANATNDNIRFFMEPTKPTGEESPYEPTKDIAGALWGHGSNPDQVNNVSAVAYSMAKQLQQKLNIPVGFLNTAIGGSVIEAWIPREEIEADDAFKMQLKRIGMYFDESFWVDGATTITGFYNAKIGPLQGYNVAGAIWYQGESNSGRPELYATELDMLKRGWEHTFGFAEGTMPFVFTQVAPWGTDLGQPQFLAYLAEAMYDGWKMNEDKRMGMIAIYDTDLQYGIKINNNADPIHPTNKTPIGQRFATSTYNMVYATEGAEYTSPVFESLTASNDRVVVKFAHVGDGLKSKDGTNDVHGFAIAAADGVYAGAMARIISKDEVEVWNPGVQNPDRVTYAWATYNVASNLMNSSDLPAAPFRSDRIDGQTYYNPQDWTFCDSINVWGVDSRTSIYAKQVGSLPAWKTGTTGASIDFTTEVKAEGAASIVATYAAGGAEFGPELRYQTTVTQLPLYNSMMVSMKNADNREKTVSLLVDGDVMSTATLKAGADFQTLVFDLSEVDTDSRDVVFRITDSAAGTVYFDNILFGTTAAEDITTGIRTIVNSQFSIFNCYDLQGRRVANPSRGLYINGGRKVVVR